MTEQEAMVIAKYVQQIARFEALFAAASLGSSANAQVAAQQADNGSRESVKAFAMALVTLPSFKKP